MFCKTCLILAIQNMSRNAYAQFPPHLDIFPPHAIPPYGGGNFPPHLKMSRWNPATEGGGQSNAYIYSLT